MTLLQRGRQTIATDPIRADARLQAAVLRQGIAARGEILVAAGTATGKTTLTKPSVGFTRAQWQVTALPDVRINYAVCLELLATGREETPISAPPAPDRCALSTPGS